MTTKNRKNSKKSQKLGYKVLETDDKFMAEMETDILIQALAGIIKKEAYGLYEIMDGIHTSLMVVSKIGGC